MDKWFKRFIGALSILTGTILYGFVHLSVSIYLPNLHGWSDPPGKIITVLNTTGGTLPAIISIMLFFFGIVLLYIDYKENSK